MIGTIGHLGQVSPRRGLVCALLHILGTTLGAAGLGVALGLVGEGLRLAAANSRATLLGSESLGLALGSFAVICGLRDFAVVSFPLPQRRRQVPESWWYTMGTQRASFIWGLVLGCGVLTFISYPAYYVVLVLALTGKLGHSILLLAACGFGQGMVLIARTPRSKCAIPTLFHEDAWNSRMHCLAGGAAVAFGGYMLASALTAWVSGP